MNNNIFLVHTPFQLFVAQQIISQEKLKGNVLLLSYIGNYENFKDAYSLMVIPEFWIAIEYKHKIENWATIRNIHKVIQTDKYLRNIFTKYQINNIFMGNINGLTYKFMAMRYSRLGYKIHFFEEGTDHYFYAIRMDKRNKSVYATLATLLDVLLYIPFFHFRFGKYVTYSDFPLENIPIDTRYSIKPCFHESYDKQLIVRDVYSSGILNYISDDIQSSQCDILQNKILFLDQPFYEETGGHDKKYIEESKDIYLKTIKGYLLTLDRSTSHVFVKFHPRESKEMKSRINDLFRQCDIKYRILSEQYSIPIEYYLQLIEFKEIVTCFSSTIFYNGLIYKKTKLTLLVDNYLALCCQAKLNIGTIKHKIEQAKQNLFSSI